MCVSGGSLNDAIVKKEVQGELFSEAELKDLLLQVSMGLKYIHSSGLVHLDIKPSMSHRAVLSLRSSDCLLCLKARHSFFAGNIFICQCPSTSGAGEGESEEEDQGSASAGVVYKIGIIFNVTFLLCVSLLSYRISCVPQGIWVM